MKVTLLHNPDAGIGRRVTAGELLRAIGNAGYTARYQSTKEPDWHRALDAATDIIAVAGGETFGATVQFQSFRSGGGKWVISGNQTMAQVR
jgi:hypothetical protein